MKEKTKVKVIKKMLPRDPAARKRYRTAWLMITPALLIRLLLVGYPFVVTVINSFCKYSLTNPQREFIGFDNYAKVFTDTSITSSLSFTLEFTVITVIAVVIIGTLLALLMNAKFKGKGVLRTVILIPWAVPTIVVALAAQWAFNDTFGFINDLLSKLLGQTVNFAWLGTETGARAAVILTEIWKHTPFFSIMVLAGLQAIPEELYESAKLDGASKFRMFFSITLPQIAKLIISLATFQVIWRATSFELVYAMTGGGPGTSTKLMSYSIMMQSVKNFNYGYGSAIALVLFVILVIIVTIGLVVQRRVGLEGDTK